MRSVTGLSPTSPSATIPAWSRWYTSYTEVSAEVTSAVALNDEQIAALKETLKASVGKDVTLQSRVDPSLLGGLIVKLGSLMIDSSLKTKLQNIKLALTEAST